MSVIYGPGQMVFSDAEIAKIPEICRPRALGPVSRLGLGSRTTVLGWPTIFAFLSANDLFANAIQNSVARELMPLEMLDNPDNRPDTYLPGLGHVQVGHTGSTIEGLVQWGAFSAAKSGYKGPGFGADADHLPVYRPDDIDLWNKTVMLIRCSRGYTHFTLDIGSIVDWKQGPISRLADIPYVIAAAIKEIENARGGEPFDLEISLDESPDSITPDAAATIPDEVAWLLDKLAADSIKVDYVAPHLGFTKGCDAAHEHLAENVEKLFRIACDHGALLSIHSGDYLSSATKQVIGRVCDGKLLYKVSPALQDIFIDAVLHNDLTLAGELTTWAVNHASERGYAYKSPAEAVHKCAFAAFGVQDNTGDFPMRRKLYNVKDEVKKAFENSLTAYLETLSDDLMMRKK